MKYPLHTEIKAYQFDTYEEAVAFVDELERKSCIVGPMGAVFGRTSIEDHT